MPDPVYARRGEIRGRLLAGLLLFADELDLEYGRAVPPSGDVRMPAVSQAHMFKHQCVDRVVLDVDENGSLRTTIHLAFNSGVGSEDRRLIQRWIVDKLRQQLGMIEPDLVQGLRRQEPISRTIRCQIRSAINRPIPSYCVLDVIANEVAVGGLLNHKDAYETALAESARGSVVVIAGSLSHDLSTDEHGREDLLNAVASTLRAKGNTAVWRSEVAHINLAADVGDLLATWLSAADFPVAERLSRERLLELLLERLELVKPQQAVLVASNIDALLEEERRWLGERAIPKLLDAAPDTRFLFSAGNEGGLPTGVGSTAAVSTGTPSDAEVVEYLSRVMPLHVARSMPGRESTYSKHRLLYQRRQIDLLEEL